MIFKVRMKELRQENKHPFCMKTMRLITSITNSLFYINGNILNLLSLLLLFFFFSYNLCAIELNRITLGLPLVRYQNQDSCWKTPHLCRVWFQAWIAKFLYSSFWVVSFHFWKTGEISLVPFMSKVTQEPCISQNNHWHHFISANHWDLLPISWVEGRQILLNLDTELGSF